MTVLHIDGLSKQYGATSALADASLAVQAGELVVILGANGCGKSTLLRCAIRLTEPSSGTVRVGDTQVTGVSGRRLRAARRRMGLVLQSPSLVRRRSVLANVAAGALGRHRGASSRLGIAPRGEFALAAQCLDRVGLLDLAWRRADQLSGGQAQRVAIARALCQQPLVLFADEPVASLDPEAAEEVMLTLRKLVSDGGLSAIVVLHQPELARRYADRLIGMKAGRIVFDLPSSQVDGAQIEGLYTR